MGGLMESMAAMMIVIVCLTAFMGLFCYIQMPDDQRDDDFGFVENLRIEDGQIVGDLHDRLVYIVESNGYSGIEVRVSILGDVNYSDFYDSFGVLRTESVTSNNGSFEITADDGRSLLAGYEVVIWH